MHKKRIGSSYSYLLSSANFIVNHIKKSGIAKIINITFSKPVNLFFLIFPPYLQKKHLRFEDVIP